MPQVISASRRTDMVMHFGSWLAQSVRLGYADVLLPYGRGTRRVSLLPKDVHTMVLWSKDFAPLLHDCDGLRTALGRYDQLFCHLTITGLGSTRLEPRIPPWHQVMNQVPDLLAVLQDPRRLSLRFDPIVHWHENGQIKSNLSLAQEVLSAASKAGVATVVVSFATLYGKVLRRKGWQWHDPTPERRLEIIVQLANVAQPLGITLRSCSQRDLALAGAMPSRCIDGELLSALHPQRIPLPTCKDPGQRPECGCTPSVDIGSYAMSCPNGCAYCYANPRLPR